MKKVLFLAVAALAYVGAANAQALVFNTGSYPAVNAVTTTSLVSLGVQDLVNGVIATPLRMTTGGIYKFEATSTDWSTDLGADWNSTLSGSIIKFVASPATTDAVYAESTLAGGSATDGESVHITTGTADAYDLTIKPTANLASFTFNEYIIKFGQSTLGAANVNTIGCGTAYTIYTNTVVVPTWAGAAKTQNNEGDVHIDHPSICLSDVAAGYATISVDLAANSEINTRYVKASLTSTTPAAADAVTGSPLFASQVLEAATPAATQTIDILGVAPAAKTTGTNTFLPGVYTFTVEEVSDDVLNNADNAYTAVTGLALNSVLANQGSGADYKVVFTILPTPRPTLTTATNN